MNPDHHDYDIHLDDKYGSLTLIDLPAEIAAHRPWFNQTLTAVNDSVVRLGIIEGEFRWHKHDDTDEFFLVLDGQLLIDLEDRDPIALDEHQGYTVPRGVVHRTRAPRKTAILMVEAAGVTPSATERRVGVTGLALAGSPQVLRIRWPDAGRVGHWRGPATGRDDTRRFSTPAERASGRGPGGPRDPS